MGKSATIVFALACACISLTIVPVAVAMLDARHFAAALAVAVGSACAAAYALTATAAVERGHERVLETQWRNARAAADAESAPCPPFYRRAAGGKCAPPRDAVSVTTSDADGGDVHMVLSPATFEAYDRAAARDPATCCLANAVPLEAVTVACETEPSCPR